MSAGSGTAWSWQGPTIRILPALALMAGWFLVPERARAQEHGSVIGVVVDEANLEPVEGALVALHDFSRRVRTDEGGRFELTEVPAGDVVIRIEEDAFIFLVETLEITPLEATLVQFRLHRIGAMLDQIVGTPDRPRRGNRRGHSESQISGSDAGAQGIQTAADLLLRSMPGLSVSREDGMSGAGLRVRLRGAKSPYTSDQPAIYLDGRRLYAGCPGHAIRALDQIPATSVRRIRILRGPASASRYPNSASGVILVETEVPKSGG